MQAATAVFLAACTLQDCQPAVNSLTWRLSCNCRHTCFCCALSCINSSLDFSSCMLFSVCCKQGTKIYKVRNARCVDSQPGIQPTAFVRWPVTVGMYKAKHNLLPWFSRHQNPNCSSITFAQPLKAACACACTQRNKPSPAPKQAAGHSVSKFAMSRSSQTSLPWSAATMGGSCDSSVCWRPHLLPT